MGSDLKFQTISNSGSESESESDGKYVPLVKKFFLSLITELDSNDKEHDVNR